MINLCKIDGKSYDVLVTAIEETTEILEGKNGGTALHKEREIRDITGIKIGHTVTFDPDGDAEAFEELYQYLFGTVRTSVTVELVHGQKTITYEAAYNTCKRAVIHIDENPDVVTWGEMSIDFRPMETQINAG